VTTVFFLNEVLDEVDTALSAVSPTHRISKFGKAKPSLAGGLVLL
jgi:hypothetical protein